MAVQIWAVKMLILGEDVGVWEDGMKASLRVAVVEVAAEEGVMDGFC